MYEKYGQFIDGKWQKSSGGETYDVINPATEEIIGKASKANSKDIQAFLAPLTQHADRLIAVSITNETNSFPAIVTAYQASSAGLEATAAVDIASAIEEVSQAEPFARIIICGSLYLAGAVLRENKHQNSH